MEINFPRSRVSINSSSEVSLMFLRLNIIFLCLYLNYEVGISDIEGFENVYSAVDTALETGYRSFDCSPLHSTERNLGIALEDLLKKHNLRRKDIIISSKILPKYYGVDGTSEAIWRSCENLKTDYIDLFLMQWPGSECLESDDEENRRLRKDTWKEMVKLNSEGVIKSTGVCHFTCKHLEGIRQCNDVIPAVNQVEFHPKCPQIELVEYCRENNILLQTAAFKDTFHPLIMNDDTVKRIAKCLNKSPAQVLLKWAINKGVAVISQSYSPKRIKQNFQLFDFVLEKPVMDALNRISAREKYLRNPICV